MSRNRVQFYLNGERVEVGPEAAGLMLADLLRYRRGLTGTKIVCAEGDCGACTVLRYFPFVDDGFHPVNSCIATVAQMDGSSLVSVEALARESLTPVQESMMKCHGSQCGFCTPGFVMALTGLVEKKLGRSEKSIEEKEAKNYLTGNLCRCTGYKPILEAACSIELDACEPLKKRFLTPDILRDLKRITREPLVLENGSFAMYAPKTLSELKKALGKKGAKIVGAGTDLGVQANKGKIRLDRLVSLHLIEELYECKKKGGSVFVGARVTLASLRRLLEGTEVARFLDLFASPQIKNVATLVGNVGNASPIADTPPFLLALDATVHALGPKGKREIPVSEFFLDYRKTALRAGECITAIEFELPRKGETLALFKSSQRKDLDISCVNAAFRLNVDRGKKVRSARIALGGVAPVPLRLRKTEQLLEASGWSDPDMLCASLQKEIRPIDDLRGSASFRRVLAENFFRVFLERCGKEAT